MIDFLYKTAEETEFIMRYPEECSRYTTQKELELFEQFNESSNRTMLCCFVDGKLAGNCSIHWRDFIKDRHRAELGIAILEEYWNLGIGTKLLKEAIKIAKNNKNILQVELGFVEGNNRARALYEKIGFKITGIFLDRIQLKDGTLLSEYWMMKKIR